MRAQDFQSPAFFADPYPYYDELRQEGALVPIAAGTDRYMTSRAVAQSNRRMHALRQFGTGGLALCA